MTRAALIEIFHSVQGEGSFVGVPMAFLRVATCPLRCLYCDTPHSYEAASDFSVRRGGGRERREPNPCSDERAAELLCQVHSEAASGGPRIVSVTGGEPLVFPAFVDALGARLRPQGWRLHLETAALDPAALARCIVQVDHLSADWKLPETLPDGKDHGDLHLQCIELGVRAGRTVDVKIVVTAALAPASFQRALARLRDLRGALRLIVQPVTPFGAVGEPAGREILQECAGIAGRSGFDVRMIPQVHRALGLP